MRSILFVIFYCVMGVTFLYAEEIKRAFDCSVRDSKRGMLIITSYGKQVYYEDIVCAFKNVFKVEEKFLGALNEDNIDNGLNYVLWDYKGNATVWNRLFVYENNKYIEKRAFYCRYRALKRGYMVCVDFEYQIDGKKVEFNDSLKGKDSVYDWIISTIPENREEAVKFSKKDLTQFSGYREYED